jgi:hypothetical protein
MGAPVVIIMIVLGIFVPFVTIVLLPLRVVYILWCGRWFSRVGGLLLLVPWGYWLVPIFKFGYVSTKYHEGVAYGTGPTVDPYNWLYLAMVWAVFEALVHATDERTENQG